MNYRIFDTDLASFNSDNNIVVKTIEKNNKIYSLVYTNNYTLQNLVTLGGFIKSAKKDKKLLYHFYEESENVAFEFFQKYIDNLEFS